MMKMKTFFLLGLIVGADLVAQEKPETACRADVFSYEGPLAVKLIEAAEQAKVYFYDDKDKCPDADEKTCQKKAYLLKGDKVLVSKTYKEWSCALYLGVNKKQKVQSTYGWVKSASLSKEDANKEVSIDWTGKWVDGSNSLTLSKESNGKMKVSGFATYGSGMSTNTGEVNGVNTPVKNFLEISEDSCKVKMLAFDKFLLVDDNLECGGLNVTFNGIYMK